MTKEKSVSWIVLLIFIALLPLGALYDAWIYSSMWGLLVRPQYGSGPSYESWYGISMLLSLLITMSVKQELSRSASNEDDDTSRTIKKTVTRAVAMLLMLSFAYDVHAVLGWA